ncbi:dephospho-CoA kinase [Arthrobacter sp. NamB2]|uniref:dephospho-CoA kinase n=1 Tax=Arthrobacter sp. NamB2 TaxID=2576035 RepID=UPI0010C98789|nr:dephospho-CoA kinase [Arthrobacter sp. NamB2]TKV28069.1 dephospho-CoA kinase [Arthrobacter sp. NamB2]
MLRIGLTGGIAAGKSVVARRFGELGAVVVDSDLLARAVVAPGTDGLAEIVEAFGSGILAADGTLDRPALGRLVFVDAAARERLNAIVHPRVRRGAAELIEQAPGDAVVVEDIPLLVETGQAARFHLVVVVDAPDALRIERMVHERGMERPDAEQRIAAQASRDQRLREADAVLPNDRRLDDLLASTDALWNGRIEPFRANLAAGRPAHGRGVPMDAAGLAGTRGLGRRVRYKLAAALPTGVSFGGDDVAGPPDDASRAEIHVMPRDADDVVIVSRAVTSAGFPRVLDAVEGRRGDWAVHRTADPAVDVTVLVAVPPAAD